MTAILQLLAFAVGAGVSAHVILHSLGTPRVAVVMRQLFPR